MGKLESTRGVLAPLVRAELEHRRPRENLPR